MFEFAFNCLMLGGTVRLTEDIRWVLYQAAFEMHQKGRRDANLTSELFEGKITATGKTAMLGTIFGHVFDANIESDGGSGMVRFIINAKDFCRQEDGVWMDVLIPRAFVDEVMAL